MEEKKPETEVQKEVETNPFTLLDVILIFIRNKKYILIAAGISCIISVIVYFFVLDLIFYSSASIKSSGKSSGLLSAFEGNLPDIGGLDDLGFGGGKSAKELAAYEDIILSRRSIEPLIDKFNLMERDDISFKDDAIKDFRENKLIIKSNKVSGIMEVGVYDKDKVLAKDMVEFILAQLDKINIELNVQTAKNNREFIEKRYFQAKEDLTRAEDSIKAFQVIYGIAPDLQIKAAAQSEFTIAAELKMEEVKLDVLKKILSPDQIEVKTQEEKISSMKNKMAEIQTSTDLNDFLRLGNSPQIAMSFLRLQRELEIQTKILTFLLPLYEQSKIEEKRETPTIMVLDKPYVAEKKAKPKRLTMVLIFTLLGTVLAWAFFIVRYKFSVLRPVLFQMKNRDKIS